MPRVQFQLGKCAGLTAALISAFGVSNIISAPDDVSCDETVVGHHAHVLRMRELH